jgi:hypothetical protein
MLADDLLGIGGEGGRLPDDRDRAYENTDSTKARSMRIMPDSELATLSF